MQVLSHVQITGGALKRWFIAQCYDSLCVALLWLIGLLILRVPWAPFWALLAMGFQFIPNIGGLFTLMGPLFATLLAGHSWEGALSLLALYAIIMVLDGFVFQPLFMRRAAKVPVWASIVVPLVMAFFFNFWGVLLSAPLLAIYYTYRARHREMHESPPPVQVIPPATVPTRVNREEPPPVIEG